MVYNKMPRTATDYSRTIIYKIVCKDKLITDLYVGHTTDFTNRKNTHHSHSKIPKLNQKKIYKIINENGGWSNWDMIEIEKFSCKDANEAKAREKYYEDLLQPTMNTNATLFVSWDGQTADHIQGKDKKETNILKARFRRDKLMEEIIVLRKENAELKRKLLNES
jgi:hypothetical protein